jgi:hypothetical protein
MTMRTQREHLAELAHLAAENPDVPVVFFVASDEICEEPYTAHEIFRVELGILYWYDPWERYYTDIDELAEQFAEDYDDEYRHAQNKWKERAAEAKAKKEAKPAIIVYTTARQEK